MTLTDSLNGRAVYNDSNTARIRPPHPVISQGDNGARPESANINLLLAPQGDTIDRFIAGIIRRKARQLVGRAGFLPQDCKDIEQDLFVRVVQSLPLFNPHRAHLYTFVTTVVERHVPNILRNKAAKKRDHRRIRSINVMIDVAGDEPTELARTIGQRELDARRCRNPRSTEELAQLVSDVGEVIAKLPDALQDLAKKLKKQTVSEIASDMGVPRTTLYESVRRLRRRFEKAGLKDYM